MPEHHLQAIFASDIVRIENYCCHGGDHDEEEYVTHYEIVFPRKGIYFRRNAHGSVVADRNHALFFQPSQPYQITHPLPGGDISSIVAVSHLVLLEVLRSIEPTVDDCPTSPFRAGHCLIETHHRLQLRQILHVVAQPEPLEIDERVLMLVASVLYHSHRWANKRVLEKRRSRKYPQDETVNHVKLMLNRDFQNKLNLHQVARAVCSSPYHLCRVFKRDTGVSIFQYLQRIRLLNALEHLAENPKQNLTRLALDLGFSSHSHFSMLFMREFDMTPSEFCRRASGRLRCELSARSSIREN